MAFTALKGIPRKRKAKRAPSRRSQPSQEPTWENWEELTGEQYHRKRTASHEWYYQTYKPSDLYPFAFQWMEKHGYSKDDIKAAKSAEQWRIGQVLAINCRLMLQGMPDFNQKEDDYWQTLPGTMGNVRPVTEFIKNNCSGSNTSNPLISDIMLHLPCLGFWIVKLDCAVFRIFFEIS